VKDWILSGPCRGGKMGSFLERCEGEGDVRVREM
jgi:hypothetical protein